MSVREFTTYVSGLSYPEAPRWHDGRLYFSDFYAHRIAVAGVDGAAETVAEVPRQPSGLGWLPDGSLIVVSMEDNRILRLEEDGLVVHADLSYLQPRDLNEMVVDGEGNAWVGNVGFDFLADDPVSNTWLAKVTPNGTVSVAAADLAVPNGTAITPDGRTLIVAESLANCLTAFDIIDGNLENRRVWASFGDRPTATTPYEALGQLDVIPDGVCLDAEGAVWVSDGPHSRLLRVREGGEILEEHTLEGFAILACMLGGDDGRSLFACAAWTMDKAQATAHHQSRILVATVDVPHAGLP